MSCSTKTESDFVLTKLDSVFGETCGSFRRSSRRFRRQRGPSRDAIIVKRRTSNNWGRLQKIFCGAIASGSECFKKVLVSLSITTLHFLLTHYTASYYVSSPLGLDVCASQAVWYGITSPRARRAKQSISSPSQKIIFDDRRIGAISTADEQNSPLTLCSSSSSSSYSEWKPGQSQFSVQLKNKFSDCEVPEVSEVEFLQHLISGSEGYRLQNLFKIDDSVVSKRTSIGTTISVMVTSFKL